MGFVLVRKLICIFRCGELIKIFTHFVAVQKNREKNRHIENFTRVQKPACESPFFFGTPKKKSQCCNCNSGLIVSNARWPLQSFRVGMWAPFSVSRFLSFFSFAISLSSSISKLRRAPELGGYGRGERGQNRRGNHACSIGNRVCGLCNIHAGYSMVLELGYHVYG